MRHLLPVSPCRLKQLERKFRIRARAWTMRVTTLSECQRQFSKLLPGAAFPLHLSLLVLGRLLVLVASRSKGIVIEIGRAGGDTS
jgi:hypothetical protein